MHFAGTPEQYSIARRCGSQRGEGKFKAIVFTVILVIGIFLAFKLVPPYVAEYQLQDKMQEMARFGIVNRYSEEQIRDNMFKVVQDLDIPAKREDIKVSVTQVPGKGIAGIHRSGRSACLQHRAALFPFQ